MNDDDAQLLSQVRSLREKGSGPKQIARALGLKPARASALVRQVAHEQQSTATPTERPVVGCWINAGWSTDLDLSAAPDWARADDEGAGNPEAAGFAQVLIARQERASRVTLCGFLVDVYCLGVKDTVGPQVMGGGSLDVYVRGYYRAFDQPPLRIGLEQAQSIVHGGVAYARTLGFEPAPDFAQAAVHLGEPGPTAPRIGFGRQGKPFYVNGPRDDAQKIVRTLERTCGAGNYHYVLGTGPL
ncbi:hypothetical protein [Streptomyces dysideae]|uniref:Helix-turn-helix domain containing protein n=1 Tax=Streptomyces dysideae TaxID=909626 RepID=A0A124IEY7_9ACTN|nr:hypothetical protein [Streptomyces dysideae]KUO19757.1 hypothetical protein AQJ91_18275 [Streptomyces dysideae]